MANEKKKEVDLKKVKPSARKRTALARESALRVRKATTFTAAASVLQTESPGLLQPETELERTYKVTQPDLLTVSDRATASKAAFHLDFPTSPLVPYHTSIYSRSSRLHLLASQKGHLILSDWREATLRTELHLNETIRSATFLHNDAFFATSQRAYAYIYDGSGAQLHMLKSHREPGQIAFLPHHLLLATVSAPAAPHNKLVYTDTTTGQPLIESDLTQKTFKLGSVPDLSLNPSNGVLHLAHASGTVSLWSPVSPRPLARIFTHPGGVRNLAVSPSGAWMATTGGDRTLKLWDLRTFKQSASWPLPALTSALEASQRGLLAVAFGAKVQVWAAGREKTYGRVNNGWGSAPYMSQTYPGRRVTGLSFCPFEDVLSVCNDRGMTTMIVPGAGEPNFDTRAPNPYETRKQRRENEVRILLDKLPPATIALDPEFAGGVERDPSARLREIRERARAANERRKEKKGDVKKAKGRNKISKRLKRKQANVIDSRRIAMQEQVALEKNTRDAAREIREKDADGRIPSGPTIPEALNRFFPKK